MDLERGVIVTSRLKAMALYGVPGMLLGLLLGSWDHDRAFQSRPADTKEWKLHDFADYVRQSGLGLRVIPSAVIPEASSSIFLTNDPALCWETAQSKTHQAQCVAEWHGTVLVSLYNLRGGRDTSEEGDCCCRIGDFVVFGDPYLVQSIRNLFAGDD
jgi:hypothetical protein